MVIETRQSCRGDVLWMSDYFDVANTSPFGAWLRFRLSDGVLVAACRKGC